MTRTDVRTYTPEFRAEAVKVVLEQGLSLEAAAQRLSVPKGTLANWVKPPGAGRRHWHLLLVAAAWPSWKKRSPDCAVSWRSSAWGRKC